MHGQTQVQTDFETGLDNWTVEGDSQWLIEAGTGNPGSCLRVNDNATGAMNLAYAPIKFLGDWSSATNSDTLRADIFLHQYSSSYVSPNFVFMISGPGGQASGIINPTPTFQAWENYKISLNPADWTLDSGTWSGLLNDVTTLIVTVEYISGDEYNLLDNVSLSFTPTRDPITPVICSDFESGGFDGWAFQGQGGVSNISSGGSPWRYLQIDNNNSGTAYAFAPTKFLGNWTQVENVADICFDMMVSDYTGSTILDDSFLRISGPGGVARIPMTTNVENAFGQWYSFTFPIQSASWTMVSGTWGALIDDVTEIRVCLEFTDGSETVGFDDFCISNLPPVADFLVDPGYTFVGNQVQFTDQSDIFPTSWSWTFGDSNSSTEKNPSHIYDQAGNYTVTLTVTNNFGNDMEQKISYIQVDPIDQCQKYSDDFTDPTIQPAWTLINGSWEISSSTMRQYSNYYGSSTNDACYAITGSPLWQDYQITADLNSSDNDMIGLVFNFQDNQNMYIFQWNLESPERILSKWVGGVETILDSDNTGYVQNTWYKVKVGSYNGNITVSIDDTEIFNVTDSAFTAGKAGLYCWGNSSSYWDNVVIECTIDDITGLQNMTVLSGNTECYEAADVITVAGSGTTFIVENGGSVTLGAGQKISFLPGTEVELGGYLLAFINPVGPWCASGSSPQPIPESDNGVNEQVSWVNSQSNESNFKIYPNPTTGTFTLEMKEYDHHQDVTVRIFSLMGEMVQGIKMTGKSSHIFDLSGQPDGLYLVKIFADNEMSFVKVIKQ